MASCVLTRLKAYRILICSDDDGRRLRSFLRLPKDLRKDWLLMEIKTSDANFFLTALASDANWSNNSFCCASGPSQDCFLWSDNLCVNCETQVSI
jgi:hypothetical protein